MNIYDKRSFKFENFKTAEELESFLYKKFPIGSDGDVVQKYLELSGCKCRRIAKQNEVFQELRIYDYILWCKYSAGWLSWPPYEQYHIKILGDENKIIFRFSISKFSGLVT